MYREENTHENGILKFIIFQKLELFVAHPQTDRCEVGFVMWLESWWDSGTPAAGSLKWLTVAVQMQNFLPPGD